jgi:lipopolysaccharide/colanic/teichoic acid biosynthesis glycosyltransferase
MVPNKAPAPIRGAKRLMDLLIAVPCVVLLGVVAPAVGLANRLTGDRGPLFYRAERVGRGGAPFMLAKFRTMRSGAAGPSLTVRGDPRITTVGRVLRRTKVDELPQVLNVIRGEMTIVGPRPEAPAYVDWDNPLHRQVFTATPGITGPSQLLHRHEEDVITTEDEYRRLILPRKLAVDAEYLERATLRSDLGLVLRTARHLLRGR